MAPYDLGEIVAVPFPFTDRAMQKRRPTLVLSKKSFNDQHSHVILAMVTSAKNTSWTSDIAITDQKSTGLPSPSVVRMKLFTLDSRLIIARLGKLSKADKAAVSKRFATILGLVIR